MPARRQRRLDQLLEKNRKAMLTEKESAELEAILDEVDRKSFWKIARMLVQQLGLHP